MPALVFAMPCLDYKHAVLLAGERPNLRKIVIREVYEVIAINARDHLLFLFFT